MAEIAYSGIVEQVDIGGVKYRVASTAYGVCDTAASTQAKVVSIPGFKFFTGVTIHVKFTNANTADNPTLQVSESGEVAKPIKLYGTTSAGAISETTGWQAGAVLSLTYDGTNWIRDQGYNTNTTYTIKDTYSGTDGNPISGKGVKAAIETLDVNNITADLAASKTITALSETDGKIAATASDIQIAESQVTNLTTHLGEKAALAGAAFTGTVTLNADPVNNLEAATKQYVDTKTAGLSGAMHFKGITTTEMTDGRTTAAVTIGGNSYTPSNGDVVLYSDSEFVWTGSAWERLGRDSSFALDSDVIKKSIFDKKGQIIYSTGANSPAVLAPNTDTSKHKVLDMVNSTPSWKELGISPTTEKAVTAVAYTANTGTWPTVATGTAFSIKGVDAVGTPTHAEVSDGTLTITNGSATTAKAAVSIPNVTGMNSDGAWPTLNVTKTTEFMKSASITYT